jgi:hypothetical protein
MRMRSSTAVSFRQDVPRDDGKRVRVIVVAVIKTCSIHWRGNSCCNGRKGKLVDPSHWRVVVIVVGCFGSLSPLRRGLLLLLLLRHEMILETLSGEWYAIRFLLACLLALRCLSRAVLEVMVVSAV